MSNRPLCQVCEQRNATTKEDIVPRWLRRELRKLDPYAGVPNQPSVLMWMCPDCNGAFAARYENDASMVIKPLIRGERQKVSQPAQRAIVGWVIKTTLLLGLARSSGIPVAFIDFIRSACREMKDRNVIPHQTFVRIGVCNPVATAETPNLSLHRVGALPSAAYHSVSMIGPFAWEVAVGSPKVLGEFARSCGDSEAFLRIWPERCDSLTWPPPKQLTMQDIYYLRAAWQTSSWPVPEGSMLRTPDAWVSEPVVRTRLSDSA